MLCEIISGSMQLHAVWQPRINSSQLTIGFCLNRLNGIGCSGHSEISAKHTISIYCMDLLVVYGGFFGHSNQ